MLIGCNPNYIANVSARLQQGRHSIDNSDRIEDMRYLSEHKKRARIRLLSMTTYVCVRVRLQYIVSVI